MLTQLVLILSGLFTALVAGVFYAFTVAVVPALRAMQAKAHLVAMQQINLKIENPLFFLSFFGALILLPVAAYLTWGSASFPLVLIATLLYALGGFGATAFGDIPLNNQLARIKVESISDEEAEKIRQDFQGPYRPWMQYHAVRTITSTLAAALMFLACLWLA